jgi:hypothetical protein
MNDNELITLVRESVAQVHSTTPVSDIISRGHAVRTRRWLAGSAGLAVAGVAAGSALAVGLSGVLGASPTRSPGTQRPTQGTNTIRSAGFVLTANADGTLSLTMSQMLDAAALEHALAAHGVPALVKTNSYCTSSPAAPDPFSDGVLTTNPPFNPKPGLVPAPGDFEGGPQAPRPGHAAGTASFATHTKTVINPAAMPSGTELFFGYTPGDSLVFAGLIYPHSYTCSSQPPSPGPKG